MEWGCLFNIYFVKMSNITTKITDCSYEIYPIKSLVLLTQAAKTFHSCNWSENVNRIPNYINWRIRIAVLASSVQRFYVSHGAKTRFAWCKSWMMNGNAKKSSKNCRILWSLPWCFWIYEAFHNNTVEHVLKNYGHFKA